MDVILVIVGISLLAFTVAMIQIFREYGAVPDTLGVQISHEAGRSCAAHSLANEVIPNALLIVISCKSHSPSLHIVARLLLRLLFCFLPVLLLPLALFVAVFRGLYPAHYAALSAEGSKHAGNKGVRNFVRDSAGYGLAQWTYWSRKQNMLEFARAAGKSIGDLEMQLDFLFKELSEGYKTVLAVLKTTASVKAASDSVLLNFERPADQSEAVKKKRVSYGQTYYDRYAGAASRPGNGGNTMTGNELRQQVCNIINGWIGATKGSAKHLEILSTYNGHAPLARGYKMQVNDAYCATTVSAAYIKAGIAAWFGFRLSLRSYCPLLR